MSKITKDPSHIFVVENDRLYLRMLDYIFAKDFSYRFVHFRSGEECLDNLHLNPDVIIIDQSLPGMSGLETLKKVREEHPHIYILALISDQDDILPSELFEAGADDYILKESQQANAIEEKVENFLNRESLSKRFRTSLVRKPLARMYYLLAALLALSAGVYYSQN